MTTETERRLKRAERLAEEQTASARKERLRRERNAERAITIHRAIMAALDGRSLTDFTATELANLTTPPLDLADVKFMVRVLEKMEASIQTGEFRSGEPVYRDVPDYDPVAFRSAHPEMEAY